LEEFADVMEVLSAIAIYYDFSYDKLEQIRDNKFDENGGFEDRIILKEVKET
jgi:predicted house-cleaning noncanonical NTP pyrophosphatase (MazG superfamily)